MCIPSMRIISSRVGIARRTSLGRHNKGAQLSPLYAQRRGGKGRRRSIDKTATGMEGSTSRLINIHVV